MKTAALPIVRAPRPGSRLPLTVTLLGCLFGCLLVGAACSGKRRAPPPDAAPAERLDEELPIELVDRLASLPAPELTLDDVILPNGLAVRGFLELFAAGTDAPAGPQDTRNVLIGKLCAEAVRLTTRSLWVTEASGDAAAQPNGLAYVYGGKRTDVRTASVGGCCPPLFGLDCSGFVARLFVAAGVGIANGPASTQRRAATLTDALVAAPAYERLHAEDLGVLALGEIESGDLVYWNDSRGRTQHIGIVFVDGAGSLAVYQSNGTAGRDRNGNCSTAECEKNAGPTRGPRTFPLGQANTFFQGAGYRVGGVVRILAELSGAWNFRLRCQAAAFDVIDAELAFPVTASSSFQIVEDFVDYTGGPLSGTFDFDYDRLRNTLSCTYSISSPFCAENPFRTERFSVRLDRDDTGYLATKELFRNSCAGCLAEVRLINLETTTLPVGAGPLMAMLFADGSEEGLGPR